MCQKGDMRAFPYSETINIRRRRTEFSVPGLVQPFPTAMRTPDSPFCSLVTPTTQHRLLTWDVQLEPHPSTTLSTKKSLTDWARIQSGHKRTEAEVSLSCGSAQKG